MTKETPMHLTETTRTRQPAPGATIPAPAAGTPGTTSPGATTHPVPHPVPTSPGWVTQAEVDRIVGDRVLRERAKWTAEVDKWRTHAKHWEQHAKANHHMLMRIDDILAEMDDE